MKIELMRQEIIDALCVAAAKKAGIYYEGYSYPATTALFGIPHLPIGSNRPGAVEEQTIIPTWCKVEFEEKIRHE